MKAGVGLLSAPASNLFNTLIGMRRAWVLFVEVADTVHLGPISPSQYLHKISKSSCQSDLYLGHLGQEHLDLRYDGHIDFYLFRDQSELRVMLLTSLDAKFTLLGQIIARIGHIILSIVIDIQLRSTQRLRRHCRNADDSNKLSEFGINKCNRILSILRCSIKVPVFNDVGLVFYNECADNR